MNQSYLEIATGGDLIRIEPIKLMYPNSTDEYDRAWIESKVITKAGPFSGEFLAPFMTVDFEMLKRQFQKLQFDFDAEVWFEPLEQQLTLKKLTSDKLGHFEFRCNVWPEPHLECSLDFTINFDQTYIAGFIRQLEVITRSFPMESYFKLED